MYQVALSRSCYLGNRNDLIQRQSSFLRGYLTHRMVFGLVFFSASSPSIIHYFFLMMVFKSYVQIVLLIFLLGMYYRKRSHVVFSTYLLQTPYAQVSSSFCSALLPFVGFCGSMDARWFYQTFSWRSVAKTSLSCVLLQNFILLVNFSHVLLNCTD